MLKDEIVLTKHSKERRRIASGEVEVCAHRVSFWYKIEDNDCEMSEDLQTCLEEAAEERAKECIVDGYVSGQLCVVFVHEQTEHEYFGWWDIKRD